MLALCASPLFIVFAYFGDPGRGQAAFVGGVAVAVAARLLWDLRNRAWYWLTLAVIVALHVPLILLVPWPFKRYSYIQLLPFCFLDLAVAYGIIRLVENVVDRSRSPEAGAGSNAGDY